MGEIICYTPDSIPSPDKRPLHNPSNKCASWAWRPTHAIPAQGLRQEDYQILGQPGLYLGYMVRLVTKLKKKKEKESKCAKYLEVSPDSCRQNRNYNGEDKKSRCTTAFTMKL
jgi:hypothetical protein